MACDTFVDTADQPVLAALGLSPGQRWLGLMLRPAAIALGGAIVAVAVAVLGSPLTPLGIARDAEPAPGFAFDRLTVLGGGTLMFVLLLLVVAVPAWRVARAAVQAGSRPADRPSRLAEALARAGGRVPTFGFESNSGSVFPPIVTGRAPEKSDEIVLGARTMSETGKSIGDTVTVRVGDNVVKMRIVGRGVLPALSGGDIAGLGEGALITGDGLPAWYPERRATSSPSGSPKASARSRRPRCWAKAQVRWTVAWQATTLTVFALALGVPLGAAAGRSAWGIFANELGIVPEPVVPLLPVLLTIPVAIIIANAVALLPGRAAARTAPAVVLRTE